MQETISALLQLQELDLEIFRVQSELKRLPLERDARKAELDKRKSRIDDVRKEASLARVRIKELDDLTTQQRQRVRKVENEAATSRQDMALLVAYQHEIRTLKREIGVAEDEGVQLLEKVEGLDAQAKQLNDELEAELRVFAEFNANVVQELAAAEARLAGLQAQRKTRMSSKVPAEALAVYTRLLSAREGVAIAHLDGRICQGCFMELPTNLIVRVNRGTELVQCPSCDRLLHNPR
jgi:predicted  nucleic acid-binding Zn-ribbon protein